MGDYQHSATVRTDAASLFEYLADVNRLPDYFEGMVSVESTGQYTVHTVAQVEGQRREGEAWLEIDTSSRSMRWGTEGDNQYHGELEVAEAGDGQSTVTVSLHTERADGPGVRAGLEQTLANIKRQIEGRSTNPA
ncbi:SRPBCC family protein [Actinopolyspora saharensis]|uniref:Polyketide cyclase / dehydrase and lipid transport n=1 Tax=Actinopolyspora saharensis TaxID=995062 RepID=A0A1H0YPA7_9ACTN|nr:SRPBCC family protein [Actinopolyspora saharensis]SDQ17062.1 Polyketide cyclase / dehydrase and lipid transport [Actinopolyspora saharensis]